MKAPSYIDFDINVTKTNEQSYAIIVRSLAGEARETSNIPFTDIELETQLLQIENSLLRSSSSIRKLLNSEEKQAKTFGETLFNFIFTGEVRSLYYETLREASHENKGVRIKLRAETPLLATLPWEFLYDPRRQDYICLDRHTPLVRYLEFPQVIQPLSFTPPLNILGMISGPSHLTKLNTELERQYIAEATKYLEMKGLVKLTWLSGDTLRDLQRAMRNGPWHIFHFIGHGEFNVHRDEGCIALNGENGQHQIVSAQQLARILAGQRSLRLVVLNACEAARGSRLDTFSSVASSLVNVGIPAALAMQYPISDVSAVEFARTFYEAIADGFPVDASVSEGRNAISLYNERSLEWSVPVLYMHAPNGALFDIKSQPHLINTDIETTSEPFLSVNPKAKSADSDVGSVDEEIQHEYAELGDTLRQHLKIENDLRNRPDLINILNKSDFQSVEEQHGRKLIVVRPKVAIRCQLPIAISQGHCQIEFSDIFLRGLSIELDHEDILRYLVIGKHTSIRSEARRFLSAFEDGSFQLSIRRFTFILTQADATDLCYCVDKVADAYVATIMEAENALEAWNLPVEKQYEDSDIYGYEILQVAPNTWKQMLQFAHDNAKSSNLGYDFYVTSSIQVETNMNTHAEIAARVNTSFIGLPFESSEPFVSLLYIPPHHHEGWHDNIGDKGLWTATFTKKWIQERWLPVLQNCDVMDYQDPITIPNVFWKVSAPNKFDWLLQVIQQWASGRTHIKVPTSLFVNYCRAFNQLGLYSF